MDIEKHIQYWSNSADEDFQVGKENLGNGRIRHGLFFIHLAVEKILKAHFCRNNRDMAPKSHNLTRLAELGKIEINDETLNVLADINAFNLEGRYPDSYAAPPTLEDAMIILDKVEKVFLWLKNQL
ncbi:MAG: HEPN domain-containing protein [Nitrospinae bacterium]|nr:HEPN domain-containing protein [Nitrospinota bacterium]